MDTNTWGRDNEPLFEAIRSNDLQAVKLLSPGLNFNIGSGEPSFTPFSYAVHLDRLAIVEYFLTYAPAYNGFRPNPLELAITLNRVQIVRAFVKSNTFQFRKLTRISRSPIWIAAQLGFVQVVKLLLIASGPEVAAEACLADPQNRNSASFTPSQIAAKSGHREVASIIDNYLKASSATEQQYRREFNLPGSSILIYAACEKNNLFEVMRLATSSSLNDGRYNGLRIACSKNFSGIVKYLLAVSGIDPNQIGPKGETPLSEAIEANALDCIKLLLRNKHTDVNVPNRGGETPLWRVCDSGNLDVLECMIASGKHLNFEAEWRSDMHAPKYGKTPLDVAREGHPTLAVLIREYLISPNSVRARIRNKIKWASESALLLAQVVYLNAGLLDISAPEVKRQIEGPMDEEQRKREMRERRLKLFSKGS